MYTEFKTPTRGKNNGSSTKLVNYLEKENKKAAENKQEYFFSNDRDKCNKWEVIQQIDNNAKKQGLEEKHDRFYSLVISPSQEELAYIGNDSNKLKDYTREVMQNYASGFCDSKGNNRGLESKDLVWYAKIENERKYNSLDEEVKLKIAKVGMPKEGDQRHIHVIVSRCQARENRHALDEERKLEKTIHLCADVKAQKIFNRDEFFKKNEQSFDKKFGYQRDVEKSYAYYNAKSNVKQQDYNQALGHREERNNDKKETYEQAMQHRRDKNTDLKIDQERQQGRSNENGYSM